MLKWLFGYNHTIKPVRDMKHSPHVPEFFIPKGPYKSMATGQEQLKMRSKWVKRTTLWLEWLYYVSVIAFSTTCTLYLTGMWGMQIYY